MSKMESSAAPTTTTPNVQQRQTDESLSTVHHANSTATTTSSRSIPLNERTHHKVTGIKEAAASRRLLIGASNSIAAQKLLPIHSPSIPAWQSLAFASLAPTIAAPFTNPFAVAGVVLQNQQSSGGSGGMGASGRAVKYRGTYDFIRQTLTTTTTTTTTATTTKTTTASKPSSFSSLLQNVILLNRGATPVMVREASKNIFRIGLYKPLMETIHDDEVYGPAPIWKRMMVGAVSGGVGALACNPFEIVRIRVQAAAPNVYHTTRNPCWREAKRIWVEDGFRGYYRATGASVALGVAITSVNLTTYTIFHEVATDVMEWKDGPAVDVICALASGFLATVAMNPIDVVRTRLMMTSSSSSSTAANNAASKPPGMIQTVTTMLKTESPSAFFTGFIPNFLRLGPHFVLTFLLLEQMRRWAHSYNASMAQDVYLTKLFEEIDVDKSGEIDFEELWDAIGSMAARASTGTTTTTKKTKSNDDGKIIIESPSSSPSSSSSSIIRRDEEVERMAKQLFERVDLDNSGSIDLTEFLHAAKSSHLDEMLKRRHLLTIFTSFDLDGNGTIDMEELCAALRNHESNPPLETASQRVKQEFEKRLRRDVQRIMKEVDVNGDGVIDFEEFVMIFDKREDLEEHRALEDLVRGAGVGAL